MGKVAQGDFDEMGARLRSRALGLMRQLDSSGGYRDVIEKELQARLGSSAPVAASASPGPESADLPPLPESACASCGTANDADARFCKNCGAQLAARAN